MADLATCPPLTRASVIEAHALIRPFVHRTPVLTNRTLDALASSPSPRAAVLGEAAADGEAAAAAHPTFRLWFKCENLQRVGAFKARGAFHAVERLKREPGWAASGGYAKGVVTHSSGNHAQALALAAATAGLPAHIVMPRISAPPKVAATRGYGARVVFSGSTAAEREAVAADVIAATGARLVPPYDHPDVILGQGTVGLELQAQVAEAKAAAAAAADTAADTAGRTSDPSALLRAPVTAAASTASTARPGLDAILAPCGGGGLLAGVVLSAEGTGIQVFGAEPALDGADDCARGLAAGRRIEAVASLTMADGLRTPVGVHNWAVLTGQAGTRGDGARGVCGVYAVGEDEIRAALRLLLERLKMVVEPSAAVPLAVVLFNEDFRRRVAAEAGAGGWDLGIVLSGGNISLEALGTLFPAAAA